MSGAITLTIDRIVLHDMDPVDVRILTAALQQALVDEFSAQPVRDSADRPQVQARLELPEHCSAGQLGRALAKSLHGVIAQPVTSRPGPQAGQQVGQQTVQQGESADA